MTISAGCIDLMIDRATDRLSEPLIKEFHRILKTGTSLCRKSWFNVGDYKKLPNEVGGNVPCNGERNHSLLFKEIIVQSAKLALWAAL